jgi:hypothetical protein
MRAVILPFACGIALATTSAQAAPLPPNPPGPVTYIPNLEWTQLPNDVPSQPPLAPRDPSSWWLGLSNRALDKVI